VSDAVTATIAAMENPAANGATINIGNDAEVTIDELARAVLATAGVKTTIEAQTAAHDPIHRRCPDITRARALLGYEPQVDLRAGLEKTLAWYRPHLKTA
jgi:nucleoside-diphosphate-sugar epimerase